MLRRVLILLFLSALPASAQPLLPSGAWQEMTPRQRPPGGGFGGVLVRETLYPTGEAASIPVGDGRHDLPVVSLDTPRTPATTGLTNRCQPLVRRLSPARACRLMCVNRSGRGASLDGTDSKTEEYLP